MQISRKPASLNRRALLLGAAALTCGGGRALAQAQDFQSFVQSLWPAAQAAGVSREVFDEAARGLTPEPTVLQKPATQSEFTVSIPAYVAGAVTTSRVARGRALAGELTHMLRQIEQRDGVPGEILVAILAVESNFGTATGGADVLRVLATLAWKGHMTQKLSDEYVAGLVLLQQGIPRHRLRGSWAGAMGMPQFMPSAYLKFATSFAGDAAPDIWTSQPDALASIASFLHKSGWNGEALPAQGAASLYMPAGASGPAFLITDNFEVIRQYNTSDAYALAVAILADRIAGASTPLTPWPKVTPLTTAQCKDLQQALTRLGFYHGTIDGKLGRVARNAVHAYQLSVGMQPADGLATKAVLDRLRGG